MKDRTTNFRLALTPDQANALASVAAAVGVTAAELAADVLAEWIGPTPVLPVPRKLEEAAAGKMAILHRWTKLRQHRGRTPGEATNVLLASLRGKSKLSRATLYNWERRWRAGGFEALMDRRGEHRRESALRPFLNEVLRLFKHPRKPKLSDCYKAASDTAKAKGWPVASYRTAHRFARLRQSTPAAG